MNGGVDYNVKQEELRAGNDPQALAQSQALDPSFYKLIAMENMRSKIKKETAEQQLAMQSMPGTIIEQREAELMNGNEQMGNLSAGIGQGGRASIPPQGMPPQGAQQGGATPGFAAGGIVSYGLGGNYAEGGLTQVEDPNNAKYIEDTMLKQIMYLKNEGLSEAEIRAKIPTNNPTAEKIIGEVFPASSEVGNQVADGPQPTGIQTALPKPAGKKPPSFGEFNRALYSNALYDDPNKSKTTSMGQDAGTALRNMAAMPFDMAGQAVDQVAALGKGIANSDFVSGLSGGDPSVPKPKEYNNLEELASLAAGDETTNTPPTPPTPTAEAPAPAVAPTTVQTEERPKTELETVAESYLINEMRGSPTADAEVARQRIIDGSAGSRAKLAEREAKRKVLEDLMAKHNDPAKLKRQGLIAALTGMGGQTTASGALASGARDGMNYDNRMVQSQKADALGIQALMDSEYKDMSAQEKAAETAYGSELQSSRGQAGLAAQTGSNLSSSRMKSEASMEIARVTAANTAQLKSDQTATTYGKMLTDTREALFKIDKQIQEEIADSRPIYKLQVELDKARGDTEKETKIQNLIEILENRIVDSYSTSRNSLEAQGRGIEKKLGYGTSTVSGGGDLAAAGFKNVTK
tara:strand:- start:339 stop:2243 length:1905 start_codon:yes stop_codon:yes gene_type:complete